MLYYSTLAVPLQLWPHCNLYFTAAFQTIRLPSSKSRLVCNLHLGRITSDKFQKFRKKIVAELPMDEHEDLPFIVSNLPKVGFPCFHYFDGYFQWLMASCYFMKTLWLNVMSLSNVFKKNEKYLYWWFFLWFRVPMLQHPGWTLPGEILFVLFWYFFCFSMHATIVTFSGKRTINFRMETLLFTKVKELFIRKYFNHFSNCVLKNISQESQLRPLINSFYNF